MLIIAQIYSMAQDQDRMAALPDTSQIQVGVLIQLTAVRK